MEIKLNAEGNLLIDTTNEKKLKGYQYDSLVLRYIRAREQMAEYEYMRRDPKSKHDISYYYEAAHIDILRFCEILTEAIGEHN